MQGLFIFKRVTGRRGSELRSLIRPIGAANAKALVRPQLEVKEE